jgi:ABC-type transport system involved in cytochrome c biogenesis permease subunit
MIAASTVCSWLALLLYAAGLVRGGRLGRRPVAPDVAGRIGWSATAAAGASWILLTAALCARGIAAGHWPLTNRYDFALCFAWAILGVYLLLELRWRKRHAGAFVIAAVLLVMTFALLRPGEEKAIQPLLPALRSVWLQFHVLTAAVGYGACGVAAGLAAAELAGVGVENIERQAQRVIGWGFPWLTAALLTGAIWAQDAWGRYWGWDPKETWTLIIWLWYLLLLHSRELRGWRGRRLAWLTIAGFGIVFFAFAGLPWLLRTVRLTSLHAF